MGEKPRFLGVKKFRERMGWKQNELAKRLGCKTTPVYHHWETGKNDPPFLVVQQLLEMGATVEELFGVHYDVQGGEPVKVAFSPAEAGAIVKEGLGFLYGRSLS